ncbi:peptidoglycan-binding protein [Actinophytocola xanthii]|uniref:Peptidoglycan-binding protein n=1 Tax=Actinophytocola xanthii TaxID=1912961 RepID=A0A1Q8CTQ4_9PSEU|nr:peptidoglycan-binding protein [Actinophytocola xanthii]OLF17737.1 peptidoglycan-binding protein [Actinophytocola xanthii]
MSPVRSGKAGRLVGAVVAVVLTAAAATAAAVGFDWGPASTSPPTRRLPETAELTRQTLVDRRIENGSLGHGDATGVAGRLGGTVTALPAPGATLSRGQALYRVDDTPVVLLYGRLPAYRTLAPGVEGADVVQFERNLAALGYTGFTVDEEYTSATAAAVADWQDDLGLSETGTVEIGRVFYAPGPVRVETVGVAPGDPAQGELLTVTGTSRVVTVELDPEDQRLAPKGAAVDVTLPDGKRVAGTVAGSRTVETQAENGGDPTTSLVVTVTVADQKVLGAYDEASVRVAFTASRRPDVLTVPVAALLALAGGGYGIEVVDRGSTRLVPVETGLFADGRVEVDGTGLTEGMRVGVPS